MEEIVRLKYPKGVFCSICGKVRKHYKLRNLTQYSCGHCGHQFSPLKGTIFENSKTRAFIFSAILWTIELMLDKKNFLDIVGKNIRRIRTEKKLTQDELADKCGFYRTYINLIKTSKRLPSSFSLYKIAMGLGVSDLLITYFALYFDIFIYIPLMEIKNDFS